MTRYSPTPEFLLHKGERGAQLPSAPDPQSRNSTQAELLSRSRLIREKECSIAQTNRPLDKLDRHSHCFKSSPSVDSNEGIEAEHDTLISEDTDKQLALIGKTSVVTSAIGNFKEETSELGNFKEVSSEIGNFKEVTSELGNFKEVTSQVGFLKELEWNNKFIDSDDESLNETLCTVVENIPLNVYELNNKCDQMQLDSSYENNDGVVPPTGTDLQYYFRHMDSIVLIQMRVKQFLTGKQDRCQLSENMSNVDSTEINAATKIQAAFRGYRTRKGLQESDSGEGPTSDDHTKDGHSTNGPTMDDPTSEGALDNKRDRFCHLSMAAVKIQAFIRGRRARKSLDIRLPTGRKLSRGRKKSRRNSIQIKLQESAAVKIQSRYRGYQVRKKLRTKENANQLELRHALENDMDAQAAALKIQSVYRGHRARKTAKGKNLEVSVLHKEFQSTPALEIAATKIQSVFRGHKLRKCLHRSKTNLVEKLSTSEESVRAAVVIQSWYRGFQARKLVNEKKRLLNERSKLSIKDNIIRKQSHIELDCEENHTRSAIIIQSIYRGHRTRKRLQSSSNLNHQAIDHGDPSLISANNVQTDDTQRPPMNTKELEKAALLIQSLYRGYIVRKHARQYVKDNKFLPPFNSYDETDLRSVVRIQRWYRTQKARNTKLLLMKKENNLSEGFVIDPELEKAAATVQSWFRGHRARKVYKCSLEKKKSIRREEKAALIIQKLYRGYKVRKVALTTAVEKEQFQKEFQSTDELEKAATCIQCIFRGYQARKSIVKNKENKTRLNASPNGTLINAIAFSQDSITSEDPRINANEQSQVPEKENRSNSLDNFAIIIQNAFRRYRKRKALKEYETRALVKSINCPSNEAEIKAATLIQSVFRGHNNRKTLRNKLELKTGCNADAVDDELIQAAILIQSWYRGYKVRKEKTIGIFKPEIQSTEKLERAAIIIQSLFRGQRVRKNNQKNQRLISKTLTDDNHELESAAVVIQHMFRRFTARKKLGKLKEYRYHTCEDHEKSAIVIQKHFRGYQARARKPSSPLQTFQVRSNAELERAATKIQSCFRGHQARTSLKHSKMHVQGIYLPDSSLVQAALLIQSCYRGHRVRQDMKLKTCAPHNSHVRTDNPCTREEGERSCASSHDNYPDHSVKTLIREENEPEENLLGDLCNEADVLRATILIQNAYRRFLSRKKILRPRSNDNNNLKNIPSKAEIENSAVTLQRLFRGYCARKCIQLKQDNDRNIKYERAVVLIQSWYRGYLLRKSIKSQINNTINTSEGFESSAELDKAAKTIQRLFRGYQVRKVFNCRPETAPLGPVTNEAESAALIIQKAYRGHRVRKVGVAGKKRKKRL